MDDNAPPINTPVPAAPPLPPKSIPVRWLAFVHFVQIPILTLGCTVTIHSLLSHWQDHSTPWTALVVAVASLLVLVALFVGLIFRKAWAWWLAMAWLALSVPLAAYGTYSVDAADARFAHRAYATAGIYHSPAADRSMLVLFGLIYLLVYVPQLVYFYKRRSLFGVRVTSRAPAAPLSPDPHHVTHCMPCRLAESPHSSNPASRSMDNRHAPTRKPCLRWPVYVGIACFAIPLAAPALPLLAHFCLVLFVPPVGVGVSHTRTTLTCERMWTLATAIGSCGRADRSLPATFDLLGPSTNGTAFYLTPKTLVDAWGTPFRCVTSRISREIRSAGPDQRMDTDDDLTITY